MPGGGGGRGGGGWLGLASGASGAAGWPHEHLGCRVGAMSRRKGAHTKRKGESEHPCCTFSSSLCLQ